MKRPFLTRFSTDRSGSILMLFGLSILFIVGIGGAGYDLGHQQLVRQKIQQATDAAALASASMLLGATNTQRTDMAMRYFNLNYPATYLGVPRPIPSVNIGANDVQVSASAPVQTSFVSNLGVSSLTSTGLTKANFKKGYNQVDLILALDNSASMGKQDVLGATTSTLVVGNWTGNQRANCITFVVAHYGMTAAAAGTGCDTQHTYTVDSTGTPWSTSDGASRMNSMRYAAKLAATKLLSPNPNNNQVAATTWDNVLMFSQGFTASITPINTFLAKMWPFGGTDSTAGLNQAKTIGTSFRSGTIHAVILLTDGGNNENLSPNNAIFNSNSLILCNQFKAAGTLVYTIGFGQDANNPTYPLIKPFLSDCATGPNGPINPSTGKYPNEGVYFFPAASATQLNAAFTTIVGSLQNLKITQ